MKKYDCIFRVDTGPGVGLGHLSRSLVLARALKKQGVKRIAFATRTPAEVSKRSAPFPVVKIGDEDEVSFFRDFVSPLSPRLTVIDSYRFSLSELKKIKALVPYLVLIDDTGRLPFFPADALVNTHMDASQIRYRGLPGMRKFLGHSFTLIDPRLKRERRRSSSGKLKLYVSLGGCPEQGLLDKIALALEPFSKRLKVDMAAGLSDNRLRISHDFIRVVPGSKAQQAMRASDAALSAAGVTSYELAYLGIPAMLVIFIKNQEAIARAIHRRGMAVNLGWLKKLSVSKLQRKIGAFLDSLPARQKAADRAKKIIDGKGGERLAKALLQDIKERQ